ncbi:CASP8 and FADD-like apoptosis regulator isoform X2 [Pyxicephalus adspersus]|uniref:CASP8 and FADD-like apoptosis regulator isoform X2 n=1 Tax=Pyxicephalus adspersus TaxID=30357 RepID=UPI003B5A9BD3
MCPAIKDTQKIAPNEIFPCYILHADSPAQQVTVMSRHSGNNATLLQIEEELETEDRDMILFACREVTCQTNIRELLSEINGMGCQGIAEVLYLVKRFDLLKKYLKMTKTEAEQLIKKQRRIISEYSYLMVDINGQLDEEDLQSLVFLLKPQLRNAGHIGKTFLCFLTDLEKNNLISPENLDLLEQSFQTIHRIDLKNKIRKYKQKGHTGNVTHYISGFAVPSSVPVNQVSSSFKPYIHNGHKDSIPVQESSSFIQPVQTRYGPAAAKAPQSQAEANDDRYPVKANPMGFCLIIDCVGNDSEMLGSLFRGMNFVVNIQMYTTIQDVKKILQDIANMEQHRHYSIFICILISRGDTDSLFFTDGNSSGFLLENIRNLFTGMSCPNLVGKPKLFFIQNYLTDNCEIGQGGGLVEADGSPCSETGQGRRQSYVNMPNEADIFWSHHKTSERQLQRLSGSPSLYLKTLNDLLSKELKRKYQDILEIHTELNRILCSKQMGCPVLLKHTLTKKLFIYPV